MVKTRIIKRCKHGVEWQYIGGEALTTCEDCRRAGKIVGAFTTREGVEEE